MNPKHPIIHLHDVFLKNETQEFRFRIGFEHKKWTSIIGPSGAGKTTLLQLIFGTLRPQSGAIEILQKNVINVLPKNRSVSFLGHQNPFFEHLNLRSNLELFLKHKADSEKITTLFEELKLSPVLLKKMPTQLSAGELARARIASVLLQPKPILLLDEPFATLDESLRLEMNLLLKKYQRERDLTVLCVTHHQEDAALFADWVVMIENGQVVSEGANPDFFKFPLNRRHALFLKSGNLLPCGHYVNAQDLHCIPNALEKQISLPLKNHTHVSSFLGQIVFDLDSGTIYKSTDPNLFQGVFYINSKDLLPIKHP